MPTSPHSPKSPLKITEQQVLPPILTLPIEQTEEVGQLLFPPSRAEGDDDSRGRSAEGHNSEQGLDSEDSDQEITRRSTSRVRRGKEPAAYGGIDRRDFAKSMPWLADTDPGSSPSEEYQHENLLYFTVEQAEKILKDSSGSRETTERRTLKQSMSKAESILKEHMVEQYLSQCQELQEAINQYKVPDTTDISQFSDLISRGVELRDNGDWKSAGWKQRWRKTLLSAAIESAMSIRAGNDDDERAISLSGHSMKIALDIVRRGGITIKQSSSARTINASNSESTGGWAESYSRRFPISSRSAILGYLSKHDDLEQDLLRSERDLL